MLIICFDTYIEFIQPFISPRMMIGYDKEKVVLIPIPKEEDEKERKKFKINV